MPVQQTEIPSTTQEPEGTAIQPSEPQVAVTSTPPEPQGTPVEPQSPATQTPDPTPAAQEAFRLREALAQRGLGEFSQLDSDDAALEYLARGYDVARQNAQVLQEYQQHQAEFQAFMQQRQHAGGQPTQAAGPQRVAGQPSAQASPIWTAPPFEQAWMDGVEFDAEQRRYRHKIGHSPELAQKVNAYQEFLEQNNKQFWQNPYEYVYRPEAIEQYIKPVVEQMLKQGFSQVQQTQSVDQFFEQNATWLLKLDPQGQPLVDPATRTPLLSDQGRRFRDANVQLEQAGVADPIKRQQLALAMIGGAPSATPAAPPATPEQQRDAANQQIQRAAATRKRTMPGTVPRDPTDRTLPSQAEGLSLRNRLLRNMASAGFAEGQTIN